MIVAKVVIIGGGVMGVSLLYHLTKAGWRDVVLLEKNDLTHGSTWHAAGLCTHFAHNPTVQELRATSVRLYRDILPEEVGQDCGFHPSGAMRITRNPDRMDEFRHVAGLSAFTGYPLEIISPQRIAELFPLAQLDGIIGGIYEPDDGHVDPSLATHAMAKAAQARGGVIYRNCAVTDIARDGSGWRIEAVRERFQAEQIVNAAGTWGWEVGEMMGLNIPSVPVLHQYLVTDTNSDITTRRAAGLPELPIIRDPEESWYVRQERDGFILGPYEAEAQVWSVDGVPPHFGADLLPADLDRVEPIIEAAMVRIPSLGTSGVKSVINGPITFTPDANPLIGPAPGVPNAWLLTGSSMGVMEGGGSGKFLAHWMTKGAPPMDPLAVDPRRFGAWADRSYRVAKAIECFGLQFGVHYPFEERSAGRDILRSPLHARMCDQGAVMGFAHGWERPLHFAGTACPDTFGKPGWFDQVAQEVETVTHRVALADLSAFSKFEIQGQVEAVLRALGLNIPPRVGRIGLTHSVTAEGGVQSEFTVTRMAEDKAYLTSAAASRQVDWEVLQAACALVGEVDLKDVTESIGVIAVMGPKAQQVLARCCSDALETTWMRWQTLHIAGCNALALRVSYIGEFGWELHVELGAMPAVYDALTQAGAPEQIGQFGAYAMNAMRLEKGYPAWGSDLTTERTPIEARLQAFIKKASPIMDTSEPGWDLVLLRVQGSQAHPFYAHALWQGDQSVGIVTSAAYGHRCGMFLALAYLRRDARRTGLSVDILGKRCGVDVLDTPPFDPSNMRQKSAGG